MSKSILSVLPEIKCKGGCVEDAFNTVFNG